MGWDIWHRRRCWMSEMVMKFMELGKIWLMKFLELGKKKMTKAIVARGNIDFYKRKIKKIIDALGWICHNRNGSILEMIGLH